jgi:hypothetical protein
MRTFISRRGDSAAGTGTFTSWPKSGNLSLTPVMPEAPNQTESGWILRLVKSRQTGLRVMAHGPQVGNWPCCRPRPPEHSARPSLGRTAGSPPHWAAGRRKPEIRGASAAPACFRHRNLPSQSVRLYLQPTAGSQVRARYETAHGLIEILLSLVLSRTWLCTGSCRAWLTQQRVCRMFTAADWSLAL